ncbi:transcriptional regulator MtlR [Pullulanibacillus camelliae]|uniref:Transcriptional regulator MtlR n=1 Tax=Pullulanibacillus camelliae TaxID=1707096 RepID=A0A8J2VKI8_9BACL|nr:PRD domain-containing protein [Pullulanibacillus camelliae]GGE29590.1 transcriptional regulator MtlR [Pullulanibacillus camelliae]
MSKEFHLLPRQERILVAFLDADRECVQIDELAERLKVSQRTIHRDLKDVKGLLATYHLKLKRDRHKGLYLEGSLEDRKKIRNDIYFNYKKVFFSPEERQFALVVTLIAADSPLKLYSLSHTFGVSESTISHDLDEIHPKLSDYQIELIRKPGFGIEVIGEEVNKRLVLFEAFKQQLSVEEWLNLLEFPSQTKNKSYFHSLLYSEFQFDKMITLDKMLRPIIQKSESLYGDQDYVYLLVQLMITMNRIGRGHELNQMSKLMERDEIEHVPLLEKVERFLTFIFKKNIAPYEERFISTFLMHSHQSPNEQNKEYQSVSKETIFTFVRYIESLLNLSLHDDDRLIKGIESHLNTSIQRLNKGMTVYNPLHDKIKEQHQDYYLACKESKGILEQEIGVTLPEDELSFLALYIAAAAIRKNTLEKQHVKAIVVCSSGIGTGHFLASRITQELKGIDIVKIASMITLKNWLKENKAIDLIISTVSLSFVDSDKIVKVSPLLEARDIRLLREKMENIAPIQRDRLTLTPPTVNDEDKIYSVAHYGEALLQIKRNFRMYTFSHSFSLQDALNDATLDQVLSDKGKLIIDLKEREKKDPFVYQDLAVLHCRSTGVRELLVLVFRLENAVQWESESSAGKKNVKHILLLSTPMSSSEEYINMISQISANLIDEALLNTIRSSQEAEVLDGIMSILIKYMSDRIKRVNGELANEKNRPSL